MSAGTSERGQRSGDGVVGAGGRGLEEVAQRLAGSGGLGAGAQVGEGKRERGDLFGGQWRGV